MRIGLIGINMYPKYLNFACGLHTYAFQQFLLQNGIDATIIDYKPVYFNDFDMRHPADYYKKLYEKRGKSKADSPEAQAQKEAELEELLENIHNWEALYEERENRYEKFQNFLKRNYITTDETYDSDLLEVLDPGFDCYICVTDVIWNLLPTHTYDRGFFLASKAMDGKQKIAYAASRGVPKPYSDYEKALFFHYLEDIDAISVREESLKEFIEHNSEKHATLVLDPVLLQDKAFWQKISVKPQESGYILLYYVMEKASNTISNAIAYAKKHNLTIVEMSDRPEKNGRVQDPKVKHIAKYDVSMEEWLGYIEHADCIFTNSFHGCCFSILFEKLFYVGYRNGDKVTNILNTFNLQSLKIPTQNELKALLAKKNKLHVFFLKCLRKMGIIKKPESDVFQLMPKKVHYEPVRKILEQKRKESQDFILSAITEAEERCAAKDFVKSTASQESYRKGLLYPLRYHSGKPGTTNIYNTLKKGYTMTALPSGNFEYYIVDHVYKNDGSSKLEKNCFQLEGHSFQGWRLRVKIDTRWFWYMNDATLLLRTSSGLPNGIKLFKDGDSIPHIPIGRIRLMVAEAVWG